MVKTIFILLPDAPFLRQARRHLLMVWNRKATFAVLAVFVAPVVIGCMPATPETVFDWNVNDQATRTAQHQATATHIASARIISARNTGAKTYIYHDGAVSQHALAPLVAPIPTPRPALSRLAQAEPSPRPSFTPVGYSPSAPASNAVSFAWPAAGPVISDFGMTSTGGKNDGINIATPMDAPIHAAASGTVIYADDGLKGYGNLVLVKHADGFTTAYAHADRLVVSRGDFVAKGQVIGYTGKTGDVSSPQLHFEIRAGTTPVNPRAYLSVQQARS
jgi:murein DD-endopeptidase MepM/ murein hydrolase activator NlpD